MPRDCTGEAVLHYTGISFDVDNNNTVSLRCTVPRKEFLGIPYMNSRAQSTKPQKANKLTNAKKPKSAKPRSKNPEGSKKSGLESVAVAYSNQRTTGKPSTTHLPNGDVVVEHCEFIADLKGSVNFATVPFPINPGQINTFPWLSQIAPNYESYKFDYLDFEYQNTVGSQTPGLVMLGADYDASDPAPADKTQFAAYQDYTREVPWKGFTQHNKKENLSKRKSYYVRTGSPPPNTDIKLYDVGNLFAATQGMADDSNVGEIYVRYKVRFMTPQIQNPAVGTSRSAKVASTAAAAPAFVAGSNVPLSVSGANSSSVTLTALSSYSCLINCYCTNSASNTPVFSTAGSTCTIQTVQPAIAPPAAPQFGIYTAELLFAPGQTFIFQNTGISPATTNMSIGQFNTSVL